MKIGRRQYSPLLRILVVAVLVSALLRTTTVVAEFRAGAAKVDITPEPGVSLDGPISKNGVVTGVNDPLHARAIVLDDGQMRLAVVICDVCMIGPDVVAFARQQATESSHLKPQHILIAGTHTHAAPRLTHIGTGALDDQYHVQVAKSIADAISQAEENLAPAVVAYGSFDRPQLISCRRFLCEPGSVGPNPFGESGERIKSVSGKSAAVIEPAGPVDPQFSILSLRHTDGTPLAVLGNYSVHYCGGYKRGIVSADYFGHYAAGLEAAVGAREGRPPFVGIMSNGTSGNTGAIQSDGTKREPYEWLTLAGRMLADETHQRLGGMEYRRDITLDMGETVLELGVRRPDAERIEWAQRVLEHPEVKQPHAWSKVYAQEALHLAKFPATLPITLQAIRIGEIAIAAAPCEVFAETGLAIKRQSPLADTFTIELANGYGGYLPPKKQHELGGYETWPARSSFLEVDAASKIEAGLVQLLSEVQ